MNNNRNRISDWAAWLTIGGLVWIVVSILRDSVRFADLARHVFFTETGEPLPRERVTKSPLIGECRGLGIYLLYNGILGDKSAAGGNVLTRAVLAQGMPYVCRAYPPAAGRRCWRATRQGWP